MDVFASVLVLILVAGVGLAAYNAGAIAGFRHGLRTGFLAHRCCGESPGPKPLPELELKAGAPFADPRS